MDVLFFSRGRGRGHAMRDLTILSELRSLSPTLQVAFASYATGAKVFRQAGEVLYDLALPERNPFPQTIVLAAELLKELKPRLVVAQEEPAAITAAAILGIRSVFTTHFFEAETRLSTQALEHAHRILFMEESGIFPEPPQARNRIHYCGPVLRRFTCKLSKGISVRRHLGLKEEDIFVLVLPGSPPERREPIFELVISAVEQLSGRRAHLLWVAGEDSAELEQRTSDLQSVMVITSSSDIESLILASDVVITKGTYNICREVMALGRPAICLTHRVNAIDDIYASMWHGNEMFYVPSTTGFQLAQGIEAAIVRQAHIKPNESLINGSGARTVAREIITELQEEHI